MTVPPIQHIPAGRSAKRGLVRPRVLTYADAIAQATPAQRKRLALALAKYLDQAREDEGPPVHRVSRLDKPAVDGSRRVEHWTHKTRLDELGLDQDDPRYRAGRRWRLDYGAAYDRERGSPLRERVDGEGSGGNPEEQWLIAADKVRAADAAVGEVGAIVLRAMLVQEIAWWRLFRPYRDPATRKVTRRPAQDAKDAFLSVLKVLAEHYDDVDQIAKQGSSRIRAAHAA